MKKSVLLTGGAGYIGSHVAVALLERGFSVVIADSFCNSFVSSISNIGRTAQEVMSDFVLERDLNVYVCDVAEDMPKLKEIFQTHDFFFVVHLAGHKSVPESIEFPLRYYRNNLNALQNVLEAMEIFGVGKLIFSSSATVYKQVNDCNERLAETSPVEPNCPYGETKLWGEKMCEAACAAWLKKGMTNVSILSLRYFNPCGSHPNGHLKENPKGKMTNLFPAIWSVMNGGMKELKIFGSDYKTKDGFAVRDYIHVVDVADAHVVAIEKVSSSLESEHMLSGYHVFNIGTGNGYSVMEIVEQMQSDHKQNIPFVLCDRRLGDAEYVVVDNTKTKYILGWEAKLGLPDMCKK